MKKISSNSGICFYVVGIFHKEFSDEWLKLALNKNTSRVGTLARTEPYTTLGLEKQKLIITRIGDRSFIIFIASSTVIPDWMASRKQRS